MRAQQRQQVAKSDAGSCARISGPEDDCDGSVNWPQQLPDASDDPGDDETEGDPIHAGFGEVEAQDSEDLDGWPAYDPQSDWDDDDEGED